jgi:hypothetical protein
LVRKDFHRYFPFTRAFDDVSDSGSDFPEEAQQERQAIAKKLFSSALGAKSGNTRDQRTWMLLNGLSSHDLSAMRELIGMPQKVLSAARSDNGLFLTVTFQ